MKKSILVNFLVMFSGLLILAGTALPRDFEKRVEKSFSVSPGGTLHLESDRGSVDVRSKTGNEVRVVVLYKADTRSEQQAEEWFDEFRTTFDQRGNDVEVRGEWHDRWLKRNNRLRIHYDILVPKEYNLDVETSGGSIEVNDLAGRVDLNTSGGSIKMGEIDGVVRANTSGGSITLEKASGEAYVHTSGGSISLGEIGGPAEAGTSGGSITVDGVNGDLKAHTSGGGLRLRNINGNLKAKTSGGSIHAELLKQIDAPVELKTSGGSIALEIPPNLQADLDASTSGGRVIVDVPLTVKGSFKKNSIRGELNGGGEMIYLRTSGGNIEIQER